MIVFACVSCVLFFFVISCKLLHNHNVPAIGVGVGVGVGVDLNL